MRFRPSTEEIPNLELTPLIDVVFLLVLFFALTTTFQQESELAIDLPEAASESANPEQASVLGISAAGVFSFDGRQFDSANALEAALRNRIADPAQAHVQVRADATTPHQAVVTALDVCQRVGITRVALATALTGAGAGPARLP